MIRNNEDRATRALKAVVAYWGDDGPEQLPTKIQDLLCDLMHLMRQWEADASWDYDFPDEDIHTHYEFNQLLAGARSHFEEEVREEEENE